MTSQQRPKVLKIYTLFDKGGNRPTAYSIHYGNTSKQMWNVAAYSLKQAYYLVSADQWSNGTTAGIVEHTGAGDELSWTKYDGSEAMFQRYKHGQRFKG